MIAKGLQGLLWITVTVVLVAAYIRYIEKRSIFFPTKEIEYLPKELGLNFEDVFFKTGDNTEINGWFVTSASAKYTVIFCHGNAGNISHRIEKLKFFHGLSLNVFIFDYRGYGRSKGRPSEKGMYLDVKGAYDYLLSKGVLPLQIIGYGESLGNAAAIDLAYKNTLKALIIDSAFTSARDMAKLIYPFLPPGIISSRLNSIEKIKSISAPKLIIHSINDEIVPYKFGQKLFAAAAEPKEFLQIHGGHNSCFFESENILREKIADFINKL